MTELALVAVIAFLIVQNTVDKMVFMRHIKSLEQKLLTGDPNIESGEKLTPNEVVAERYRDIADVSIESIANNIKQKLTK